jgi:PAS domain S-box-containing protein
MHNGAVEKQEKAGSTLDAHELIRQLQTREAELALIHGIAGVGGVEVDLRDGYRNRRSPEYLTIHGLQPSASNETHEDWVARIHPEDRERTERQFLDAVAGTTTDYAAEYRIIRPSDGQVRWVRVAARIERDADNRAIRLIGAHFDVTDAKLAEQVLRESEERFRVIANNAPIPMWVTKFDGDRLFVNRAYADFFGVGYEEALKLDWRARVHPEDASRLLNAEELRNLQGDVANPFVQEMRVERVPGDWRWIKAVSQPRLDERGEHVGFIGVAHDVTIAKQAEVELRRINENLEQRIQERTHQLQARELQMRTILETSNQYHCLLDRDGRIQFANRTALASVGKTLDEMHDTFFWEAPWFVRASQSTQIIREAFEAACRGEPARTELSVELPIGHRVLEIGMRPIADPKGAAAGILVEALDITERRHNEEVLRQSQKMEAVGQLTGGVAHDFNNLLTIINSATEFLQRPDLEQERRRRYVGLISETVARASKLTSQLLAFARRHPMQPESFDVGRQIEAIAQLLQPVLGNAIVVELDLQIEACSAVADVAQFETAVINLALNARDAMPDGGTLTFRVFATDTMPTIRGEPPKRGRYVAVSVSDTGTGIDPQLLERIFEPFFTTKQTGKGTGLGLSQAFGFSKQSGGELEVRSKPGHGSTFSIYLPKSDVAHAEEQGAKGRNPEDRSAAPALRILVVEDNEDVGMLAAEQLRALGQKVHWTKDANDALMQLETGQLEFDVMFSDIVMPGMNGIELANRVSQKHPHIGVVLTTGYSNALAESTGTQFVLIRKPYSISGLLQALQDVMAAKRNTEPA